MIDGLSATPPHDRSTFAIPGRRAIWCIVLLAVLAPLPPCAAADRPTGGIPSLGAAVTGLSLFTGGGEAVVPLDQRRYDERFLGDTLQFVYYELNLSHPAPGRRLPFTIEGVWRGPHGIGRRDVHRFALEPSWTGSNWTSNARLVLSKTVLTENWNDVFRCRGLLGEWGPCDSTSGVTVFYWPKGTYRVEIFADDALVATNHFRVLSRSDIDAEMRARMSDGADPSGYIASLDGRIAALRFFDGGPPVPRTRDRRYASEFPRTAHFIPESGGPASGPSSIMGTRTIGWQLDVKHKPTGRWQPLTFEAFWYRREQTGRRLVQRKVLQTAVSADWKDTSFDDDSGAIPKIFQVPGRYLLELYAGGKKVGGASFAIR